MVHLSPMTDLRENIVFCKPAFLLSANPCPYNDESRNCDQLQDTVGCNETLLNLLCRATCNCETEIK